MKIKYILSALLMFLGTMGFSQSQNLDKELKEGISELSEILETLDLNKILNEDLFGEIEKMKPSEKQMNEMQSMMTESLKAFEKIDFSAFDEIFNEMEKAMEKIKVPSELQNSSPNIKVKPSKGKRI